MRNTLPTFVFAAVFLGTVMPCKTAASQQPEANPNTLSHLHFRLVDDQGTALESVAYTTLVYSLGHPPLNGERTTAKLKNGVLQIPVGNRKQGRIRFWTTGEGNGDVCWTGYGEYSFDLIKNDNKPKPTLIKCIRGRLLRGHVVAQNDGSPIAGAQVAPSTEGPHWATWIQWDQSVLTDKTGAFRLATTMADGIAAKHADYAEQEIMFKENAESPADIRLVLSPLRKLRGKLIGEEGQPVQGVHVKGSISDASGRFTIRASVDDWRSPKNTVTIYPKNYAFRTIPLREFDLNGHAELVLTLKKHPRISGEVISRGGHRLEECQVQIKPEYADVSTSFGPPIETKDGRWDSFFDPTYTAATIRVITNRSIVYERRYTRDALRQPIQVTLPHGKKIQGMLSECNFADTPTIVLRNENDEAIRVSQANQAGAFEFAGLGDGDYRIELYPAHCRLHCSDFASTEPPQDFRDSTWSKAVSIDGEDIVLTPIDLKKANVLPGKIEGVAFDPRLPGKALSSGFVYLANSEDDRNSAGGIYYVHRVMTDSMGKFSIDPCPPGRYYLVTGTRPYWQGDNYRQIVVVPAKTLTVKLNASN